MAKIKKISLWKVLITITFCFSLVNLGINFNLINIEKIDIETLMKLGYFETNNIEKTEILSNSFLHPIGTKNNTKVNYHNSIMHDSHGNTYFLKDYPYNEEIWYADCNIEKTNCVVYSSFRVENNKDEPICFESGEMISEDDTSTISKVKIYPYAYKNPDKCVDYNGIE